MPQLGWETCIIFNGQPDPPDLWGTEMNGIAPQVHFSPECA